MCFGSPDMPEVPEPKDPILPKQPLQQQQPAGLDVGRKDDEDSIKTLKKNRSRGKLRIKLDKVSTQAPSAAMKASGANVAK